MVYCVIPRELEGELFERMRSFYADNPEVTVIVDRRRGERRRRRVSDELRERRELRDRRRRRVPGEFPPLHGA